MNVVVAVAEWHVGVFGVPREILLYPAIRRHNCTIVPFGT